MIRVGEFIYDTAPKIKVNEKSTKPWSVRMACTCETKTNKAVHFMYPKLTYLYCDVCESWWLKK